VRVGSVTTLEEVGEAVEGGADDLLDNMAVPVMAGGQIAKGRCLVEASGGSRSKMREAETGVDFMSSGA
jgi:nicotinate-nucleotide pyrophosphorylase